MKWAVAALVGLVMLIAVLWWLPDTTKVTPELSSEDAMLIKENQLNARYQTAETAHIDSLTKRLVPEPEMPVQATEDIVPSQEQDPLVRALESMRESLSQPDARTPPMAKRETPEPGPSEQVLADPSLYLQYEASQSAKLASIYLTAIQEIPMLRDMIQQAKASGSRTAEEIRDAEEALEQMMLLRAELERDHPEVLNQLDRGEYPTAP